MLYVSQLLYLLSVERSSGEIYEIVEVIDGEKTKVFMSYAPCFCLSSMLVRSVCFVFLFQEVLELRIKP